MDYEKAYKEALERAQEYLENSASTGASMYAVNDALKGIFPELAESEDERIRKGLVNFLQSPLIKENLTDEKVAPWINYLENQQSSDWSEEDKENLNDVIAIVRDKYDDTIYGVRLENFLKSLPEKFNLQSKQEWSEEDEKMVGRLRSAIKYCLKNLIKNEDEEEKSNIPVPKTVDEAISTLEKILSDEDREYLLKNGAISVHHSLGRWIRNEWGLWTGSELKDELMSMNKGLNHPDDMSNYIIEEFIKYWNNKL